MYSRILLHVLILLLWTHCMGQVRGQGRITRRYQILSQAGMHEILMLIFRLSKLNTGHSVVGYMHFGKQAMQRPMQWNAQSFLKNKRTISKYLLFCDDASLLAHQGCVHIMRALGNLTWTTNSLPGIQKDCAQCLPAVHT